MVVEYAALLHLLGGLPAGGFVLQGHDLFQGFQGQGGVLLAHALDFRIGAPGFLNARIQRLLVLNAQGLVLQ